MTYTNPLEVIEAITGAFLRAERYLTPIYSQAPGGLQMREPLDFIAFNQQFSDTSCGFGGMAGQAFTDAPVIVIFRERNGQAAVFVGGRFAYVVEPNEHPGLAREFWDGIDRRRTIEAYSFKQTVTELEFAMKGKKP